MKRRILIILSLLIVIGQWASLEHAYHDHTNNEICEYCLSAQPFDHAVIDPIKTLGFEKATQSHFSSGIESPGVSSYRYYLSRAPPHSIQIV